MRVKSYFAGTVEEALRLARQEMGEDALLLRSREASPEARYLGRYEVVFGLPAGPAVPDAAPVPPRAAVEPAPVRPAAAGPDLTAEVAAIRRELERMSEAVSRSSLRAASQEFSHPQLTECLARLVDSGVEPGLAFSIVKSVEKRLASEGTGGMVAGIRRPASLSARQAGEALAAELESRIRVSPGLSAGEASSGPAVVALVGPPGAGKTTTLVKLAAVYGVTARRPTQLLSMDTWRIAAAEQLRCYAAILGAGFQACETTGALAQALEEHRHKGLILIDTPGFGPRDSSFSQDLARFLASRPDIETHLVLSSSAKSADLSAVTERFLEFRPARLLFTRLDETATYGAVLNEACRTGLPVSFLTFGQEIPEDLEAATQAAIAGLLLEGRRPQAAEPGRLAVLASAG